MLYSKRISIIYSIVFIVLYLGLCFVAGYDSSKLLLIESSGWLRLLIIELALPPILAAILKRKQSKFEMINSKAFMKNQANYITIKTIVYGMPFFSAMHFMIWVHELYDSRSELWMLILSFSLFHLILRVIKCCILIPYYRYLKRNVKDVKQTIKIYKGLMKGRLPDLDTKLVLFINQGKSRSTQGVNHLYFSGENNTYLLNEDELFRILRGKPEYKRILTEQIACFCYLLEPESKEEFYDELDLIYEKIFVKSAGSYNKQVIIFNYSDEQEHINIPAKFKTVSAIKVCPISSTEEITEAKIRLLMGQEQSKTEEPVGTHRMSDLGKLLPKENGKDLLNFKTYFENSNYFLDEINCYGEYTTKFQFENEELRNFFSSAVTFQNPIQSIMALIDYIEIILRLSAYYYGKKEFDKSLDERIKEEGPQAKRALYRELLNKEDGKKKRKEIIPSDLFSLGYEIWKEVKEEDPLYDSIRNKSYRYTKVLQPIFNAVGDFIYANFEGYKINFLGLVRTVNHIRNKVIAHGSLQSTILYPVWCLLFYSAVALTEFLGIEDMKLDYKDDMYWVSYVGNETKVSMGNLVVKRNHFPCLAWNISMKETQNGFRYSLKYINYFEGEMIQPEHFEENFAL